MWNGRKAGFDLQLDFWQKSTSLVDFQKSSAPALVWMLQRSIAMNGGVQCSNSTMLKSSFPFLHDGTLPVVTYHIPRRLCNLSFEQALVVDPHPLILSTFNTIVTCEKWKKSKSLFHVHICENYCCTYLWKACRAYFWIIPAYTKILSGADLLFAKSIKSAFL